MEPIYLDNGTIARPSEYLFSQMQPFIKRHWHSLAAPYLQGKEPFTSIQRTQNDLRAFVGARTGDHFQFTSSGAAATQEVYQSFFIDQVSDHGKNHLLTTSLEEVPMQLLGKRLEKMGIHSKNIPLNNNGQVTREALESVLTPKTGLLSLSWANALTGVIHPIWELAELCRERGVLVHVDASAILGKLYFKFCELPLDYLTFEGTSLHGPKGSGGLFVRKGVEYSTGYPEEVEGASLNLASFIGLGIAIQELSESFDHLCMETARLRNHLESEITRIIPDARILFADAERLPNTTAIVFPDVMSELLAFHLRERGVFVSYGGGRQQKLTALLTSCGVDPHEASCALSFSLSRTTTEEEINSALGHIIDAYQKCSSFSKGVCR